MKKNKLIMLTAALVVFIVAGFAVAQEAAPGPQGPRHHRGFGGPGMMFRQLNLTDTQKNQLKQIFSSEKPTLHPLMLQEGQAHQQIMQLVTSGNFDEAKAQAIIAQETQTHSQIELEHAKMMSQAYQILTPDQKTKFAELQSKHQQWMANHANHDQPENAPPPPSQ